MKKLFVLILLCTILTSEAHTQKQWTESKAAEWYAKQGWLRGCNYQPSTAINQLEMFQAETFDTATINRELGWARDLGLNTMRVFLHHLLWTTDKEGFKKRLDQYLSISYRNKVKTILVFFDDCWNDSAKAGKQPAPKTGVHNSGWVRDPGTIVYGDPQLLPVLKKYVQDVLSTFKNDERIVMWDLYNEPGNNQQFERSLPLLQQVFAWAREINPSQPISAGLWSNDPQFTALNKFQLDNSDVITYHDYGYVDHHMNTIDTLKKKYNRPLICTEYMARKNGSLFQVIMPVLKSENIGAINWGFVSGKTNTIYAWGTPMPDGKEPPLWFHDIYRKDGTPFSKVEVEFIKKMCAQ